MHLLGLIPRVFNIPDTVHRHIQLRCYAIVKSHRTVPRVLAVADKFFKQGRHTPEKRQLCIDIGLLPTTSRDHSAIWYPLFLSAVLWNKIR